MLRKVFGLLRSPVKSEPDVPLSGVRTDPVCFDLDALMRDRMEAQARFLVRDLKQRGVLLVRLMSGNFRFTSDQISGLRIAMGGIAVQSCCIDEAIIRGEVVEIAQLGVLRNAASSIKKIDALIEGVA